MASPIRTVADLADAMKLTDVDDLLLLHRLARNGTVGPAALCHRFYLCKHLATFGPQWPQIVDSTES